MSLSPAVTASLDFAIVAALKRLDKPNGAAELARWQQTLRTLRWAAVVAYCAMLVATGLAIGSLGFDASAFIVNLLIALSGSLSVGGGLCLGWGVLMELSPNQWAPLSAMPLECAEALELVREYQVAREIRDRALASGRQLYVLDLFAMQAAVAEERCKEVKAKAAAARNKAAEVQHQRCAELHGLT